MKCIRCGKDSRYRERSGGRCPRCNGAFAFEPQIGDPMTDMAFQRAIAAVSADGRVRWGVEHLYYEVCRRKRLPLSPGVAAGLLACEVMGGVATAGLALAYHRAWWLGTLAAAFMVPGTLSARAHAPFVRVASPTFDRLWKRWCGAHGMPAGVIVRDETPGPPPDLEPDLADYSFDRAVICDRARTVDLLLANNFHFENNCAVLSIDGYPPGPFPVVRAMLRRNPKLQAYALHDATPAGCDLAYRLAGDPDWFAGGVKVIDVGLRPTRSRRFRGLLLEAKDRRELAGEGVTTAEARWLEEYALELAAIRPEQVLKRLFRAIHVPIDPAQYAAPVIVLGGMTTDARDAVSPADSFG